MCCQTCREAPNACRVMFSEPVYKTIINIYKPNIQIKLSSHCLRHHKVFVVDSGQTDNVTKVLVGGRWDAQILASPPRLNPVECHSLPLPVTTPSPPHTAAPNLRKFLRHHPLSQLSPILPSTFRKFHLPVIFSFCRDPERGH